MKNFWNKLLTPILLLYSISADKEDKLAMLENTNITIKRETVKLTYDTSEDTRIREIARLREKALHDEASMLSDARDEGRAEGRAEGRSEGIQMAKESFIAKLKARGMSDSEIEELLE